MINFSTQPAVTVTTYGSDVVLGGVQTITGANDILHSVFIADYSETLLGLRIYLYDKAPVGTYTDALPFNPDPADQSSLIHVISVPDGSRGSWIETGQHLATTEVSHLDMYVPQTFYAVAVTAPTPNPGTVAQTDSFTFQYFTKENN